MSTDGRFAQPSAIVSASRCGTFPRCADWARKCATGRESPAISVAVASPAPGKDQDRAVKAGCTENRERSRGFRDDDCADGSLAPPWPRPQGHRSLEHGANLSCKPAELVIVQVQDCLSIGHPVRREIDPALTKVRLDPPITDAM